MIDQIISFLKPQYPSTYLLFLEHLVIETELQIEKYHTQLALAYLENIRKAGISKEVNERTEANEESKSKFYTKDDIEAENKSNSQFYSQDTTNTIEESKSKFYAPSDAMKPKRRL